MFATVISNHPNFEEIKRTIELTDTTPDCLMLSINEKKISTKNKVKHYLNEINDENYLNKMDCLVNFCADNQSQIPVSETETIGDYDYLVNSIQNNLIGEAYSQMMEYLDGIGRINTKCNY